MVVINKAGGAGAEGFLDVKESKGDPHKVIITLSNLFTTPLATHTPFNWRDLTPVQMMALDNFVLWVNAETPYKTTKEYLAAAKAGGGKFKMGGTGSKQEDQIITVAIEKQTGAKFTYISYRGGGSGGAGWWASTSTRQSTIRSKPSPSGARARCGPFACSTPSACPTRQRSPRRCPGTTFPRARTPASTSST
jgi:hypothetical protein